MDIHELQSLSNHELTDRRRRLMQEAARLKNEADACQIILVGRDAFIALNEAEASKVRAKIVAQHKLAEDSLHCGG